MLPAVVTLSLGVNIGDFSKAIETTVKSLSTVYGILVVVASGNTQVRPTR